MGAGAEKCHYENACGAWTGGDVDIMIGHADAMTDTEDQYNAMIAAALTPPHITMTQEEAQNFHHWKGMDGAVAFHLIDRHARSWSDTARMMEAWRKANETQWIPVSERLPLESDGTVAVLLDDGEAITGWGKYSHNRFYKWGFPCDVYNDCVTHWCKLPPLQKNEGADK